jgi:hypothetical protein
MLLLIDEFEQIDIDFLKEKKYLWIKLIIFKKNNHNLERIHQKNHTQILFE